MYKRKDGGFSLLEIIIVLAIIGGILVIYTQYARKQALRATQQTLSSALVQEMKGVINFVGEDDIAVSEPSGLTDDIDNPLYSTDTKDQQYRVRLSNKINDIDTGNDNQYYLWGEGNNAARQQRYLFISQDCKTTLKSDYTFVKEYLSCLMSRSAQNPAMTIERIGFRGDPSSPIDPDIFQIDVIAAFVPDTTNDKLSFASYYPMLSKALSDSSIVPTHAWVVHRASSAAHWQIVTKKNDGKTPIEFGSIGSDIESFSTYSSGQFGVRLTFDMNDSSNNSADGGGADKCWNSDDKKVELCFTQNNGEGSHGEDSVVALNMTDTTNARGDQMAGTLKSNLVMENTARPVYIFKREYGGDLVLASDGTPERIVYTDDDGNTFMGDFYLGTRSQRVTWNGHSTTGSNDTLIDYYRTAAFDTYELVTPSTSEYSGYEYDQQDITDNNSYIASYDDGSKSSGSRRFSVQACPKIEQSITLRDAEGNPLTDSDGNKITKKITRELYPQLSASISSVSAYSHTHDGIYLRQDKTRENLDSDEIVGMLGGITVQVELAVQDKKSQSSLHDDMNAAGKMIFPNSKYVWVVTSTMGMYDSESGSGKNIVNPLSISYTITKWCSTVPQMGTPADLLSTTKYESNMDED